MSDIDRQTDGWIRVQLYLLLYLCLISITVLVEIKIRMSTVITTTLTIIITQPYSLRVNELFDTKKGFDLFHIIHLSSVQTPTHITPNLSCTKLSHVMTALTRE